MKKYVCVFAHIYRYKWLSSAQSHTARALPSKRGGNAVSTHRHARVGKTCQLNSFFDIRNEGPAEGHCSLRTCSSKYCPGRSSAAGKLQ